MQFKMNPTIVKSASIVGAVAVSSFIGFKLFKWYQQQSKPKVVVEKLVVEKIESTADIAM